MDSRLPSWIHFHVDDDDVPDGNQSKVSSPSSSPRRRRSAPASPQSRSPPSSPASPQTTQALPSYVEPLLLQLIRQGDYQQAMTICESDSNQARPVLFNGNQLGSPVRISSMEGVRHSRRVVAMTRTSERLYYPTALGVFCRLLGETSTSEVQSIPKDTVIAMLQAIVKACPWQLRIPHGQQVHTPLRQLVSQALNGNQGSVELIRLVLQADAEFETAMRQSDGDAVMIRADDDDAAFPTTPAIFQIDSDGLDVVDHVVSAIQLGSVACDSALDLVKLLLEYLPSTQDLAVLVKLFSLGTSFGFSPPPSASVVPSLLTELAVSQQQLDMSGRLERILHVTRRLLLWRPSLLLTKSALSGCTPLHAALRNYGNFDRLIRELITHQEDSHSIMKERNIYGDLPLHVACAVGVPMDVLHLILVRTLQASSKQGHSSSEPRLSLDGPHNLVWSKNLAGYTPIDLEWIRHIEAGNGFFSHRTFYPLDSRGVRTLPSGRSGELYKTLLRQAVDQIIEVNDVTGTNSDTSSGGSDGFSVASHLVARVDWTAQPNRAFGLLLHRIFLIIRAAFHDSFSTYPVDLSGDILHLASALISPTAPSLPRPIGELILWQYPEEIKKRDHLGRLPLHCCFASSKSMLERLHGPERDEEAIATEWTVWVEAMIGLYPFACQVRDNVGRLPIHYALLQPAPASSDVRLVQPGIVAMTGIIKSLVIVFPHSVQICDPVTGLHPFLMAASNQTLPLDTIFGLLNHSPSVSNAGCQPPRRKNRKRALSSDLASDMVR